MASRKLDLTINTPTKKTDLTKGNMLNFMKTKSTKEKEWFVKLMKDNKKKQKNNLTDETIEVFDMKPIREAFAQKYFPDISDKGRKAKTKKEKKSFAEELESLLG